MEVIAGREEWLFLKEGTNRSLSYLTGTEPVSPGTAHVWNRAISFRQRLFLDCIHLICPEKLAVFSRFADHVVLDPGRLACKLAHRPGVIYPVGEMATPSAEGLFSYSRTDTHFNDLGAWRAATMVLEQWGISPDFVPVWGHKEIIGDLGMKFTPVRKSYNTVMTNSHFVRVTDNKLRNRGRISRYVKPSGGRSGNSARLRLLIFGDSFSGINLARMFANFVDEVLFVHSLSADFRIVKKFAPDVILFEMAERFLRETPEDGVGIEKVLAEKVVLGEVDNVAKWRMRHGDFTADFVDWPLLDFIAPQICQG
ncbi:hypothetical protein [Jiella mangrovi]|uniref:AlgX/AlgJ SGNH hydrolase-like domain-containing protein n=1 Tax=Jiella mangrovi TaxID=2821407 RepID=A0ABS4BM81_9HYPH|nr:hypothetical protein [Jiella mangrovi]MBP0617833.1 hypothetical protein [Jiella mangrovi]